MKDLDKGSQSTTLSWCSRLWGCGPIRRETRIELAARGLMENENRAHICPLACDTAEMIVVGALVPSGTVVSLRHSAGHSQGSHCPGLMEQVVFGNPFDLLLDLHRGCMPEIWNVRCPCDQSFLSPNGIVYQLTHNVGWV